MAEKKKSPARARLANFVCVDKKMVKKSLSQFQAGRKTREEVEVTVITLVVIFGLLWFINQAKQRRK